MATYSMLVALTLLPARAAWMLPLLAAVLGIFIDRPEWNDPNFKRSMSPVTLLIIALVIVLLAGILYALFTGDTSGDIPPEAS